MRYAVYNAPAYITLHDRPIPRIEKPDDVLIRVCYAGICDDDIPFYLKDDSLATWPLPSAATGHEFSGIIEDAGSNAKNNGFHIGDHVSGLAWKYCGICENCLSGDENHCSNIECISAFSEYVVAHQRQLVVVPQTISLTHASFVDPVSYALYNLQKKVRPNRFRNVLIFGINAMSMIMLQLAKKFGADRVVVIEQDYGKYSCARKLGASDIIPLEHHNFIAEALRISDYKGYDMIFEMSRNPDMLLPASQLIGIKGSILYSYPYSFNPVADLSLINLYLREVELVPFFLAGNALYDTVKVMQSLDFTPLISKVYPFNQINEAFKAHLSRKYIKILIDLRQ